MSRLVDLADQPDDEHHQDDDHQRALDAHDLVGTPMLAGALPDMLAFPDDDDEFAARLAAAMNEAIDRCGR